LNRINEAGRNTTVEDARNASLTEASASLAGIDRADFLFRASPDDLRKIVNDAVAVVTAARALPVDLTAVTLSPDRQTIQVGAEISGILDGGIRIDGRIHGAMVPSFSGRDLVLRTAFDRIELRSVAVPGWHWLPGGIVRLLNPAIADAIARINGAISVNRQVFLPEPTAARTVQVGNREIVIPALAPATPAAMIDEGGLHVLAQLLAREPGSTPRPPEGTVRFAAYRSAFAAKAEASHAGFASLPLGTHFSNVFLDRLLGDLRVVGTTEDLAREAVRTAARGLNQITGPDIVLRIPADQAVRMITGIVADALSKGSLPATVERVRPSIEAGAVVIDADARAEIPISPTMNATTILAIRIVAIPEGSREGERDIRLLPRVAWVRTVSTSMAAPGDAPFADIGPTFNAFVEGLVATVNSLLPAVPIALPAASTEPVDIPPVAVAGGSVAISPARFQPPAYRLDRLVVATSVGGLWILADASVPGAPAPSAAVQRLPDPAAADAAAVDAAISALVAERYGETPANGVFGLVSWRRFAEIFNAGWMSLGPSADARVDTGTVPIQPQSINLVERGSFSCSRTEQCDRPSCQRASCSRGSCDWDCMRNTPFGSVEDPFCATGRNACNAAAELELGRCNTAAELELGRCNTAAEATVFACNLRAETQVGLCQARLLVTNGIAEISGVGSISGDSRVRVNASLDARRLVLTPDTPGAEFHPVLAGTVVGNLALDWTPYDAIGHLLVCPVAGKIFAEVTATFPGQPFRVAATVEDATQPSTAGSQRGPTVLRIRTTMTRAPVRLEPGLLTALVAQNAQILLTCAPASSLLVPGLVMGGAFRAIAEDQLAAALAPTSPATALLLYASQDADVRATMSVLFGGTFSIPIDAMDLRLPLPDLPIAIPGGQLVLRPVLERAALRFAPLQ
jgi:hypothetical protein